MRTPAKPSSVVKPRSRADFWVTETVTARKHGFLWCGSRVCLERPPVAVVVMQDSGSGTEVLYLKFRLASAVLPICVEWSQCCPMIAGSTRRFVPRCGMGACTPGEGMEAVIRLSTVSPRDVSPHERMDFYFQNSASLVNRKPQRKRGDLGPLKDNPAAFHAPGCPI